MCDHRVVLHHCVVRAGCHPSGAAVATCLNAAARTRWAARAVQGDVVSVWQLRKRTPSAPPIPAQRVARFDDHGTHNCLLKHKLRQRYSRSKNGCSDVPCVAALIASTLDDHHCVAYLSGRLLRGPFNGSWGHLCQSNAPMTTFMEDPAVLRMPGSLPLVLRCPLSPAAHGPR